ncbi:MAG: hypothetical protein WCO33_03730 [bacterium]
MSGKQLGGTEAKIKEENQFSVNKIRAVLNNPKIKRRNNALKPDEVDEAIILRTESIQILTLRSQWSDIFKVAYITILVFEIILTIFVGTNVINVEKKEVFFNIIIGTGMVNLLTMPLIVAKFLFGKDSLFKK